MPSMFYVTYGALWILVIVQSLLLLLVYRHFGMMALGTADGVSRDGLGVGQQAPSFRGVTGEGQEEEWIPALGHYQVLAFVSPECQPCAKVLPSIGQLARHKPELSICLVVSGGLAGLERLDQKFLLPAEVRCYADQEAGISGTYRVRVTPFAYLIGRDGQILAKGLCDDVGKLRRLVSIADIDVPQSLDPQIVEVAGHRVETDALLPRTEQRLVNE